MKKKVSKFFKQLKKKITKYLSTNRLFLIFVILTLIETILVRNFTLKNTWSFKPFICDMALIVIIGSFGYFIKPKKQFNYYFTWLFIITLVCVINSIYYTFYTSFASFSLLTELSQVGEVGDSVYDKLKIADFIYFFMPIIFICFHIKLKKGTYYHMVNKVEKSMKMFGGTLLAGIILLSFTLVTIDGTDASRLVKQWNRSYIVQRFGIILYQGNDLIQSLTPKINSLFGYDEAAKEFKDFYSKEWQKEKAKNKYTDVLEGMNVIFVHLESIQNYLVDMKMNGQDITPTLNKLTREGMYFSNFYPQISVGTSSDTEFTLNSSLMPASSGTVFVSYYKHNYLTIPKLLKEKGYHTFSTHANDSSMWNRNNMHPSLGYEELIFKDQFEVKPEDCVGLGLNDVEFFRQLQTKLETIEDSYDNYMGTVIQLSNHSPFAGTANNPQIYDSFGKLDLTSSHKEIDEKSGKEVEVKDSYMEGTELGDYFISAHYADMALGTFIDYINNSDHYNNTVFVFYGDHDARIGKKEYQYFYNYDVNTGKERDEDDPLYVDVDTFTYELSKNTPLVIWTKNADVARKIKFKNNNVMGMYDVLPTIGNMMGFNSQFALGHDIYDIGKDNVVIFPSGNFLTNKIYYNNTTGTYRVLNTVSKYGKVVNVDIEDDYIDNLKKYTEERLSVSNNIIVHDLIEKEGNNVLSKKEE